MNHYTNNESLAFLGHGKWKSALRHTLLIIGMVLMSLGAYAQNFTPIPEGLKMEKKWEPTNDDGTQGNILVETYVTGHSVAQHVPTDIVLVLDVSGSMNENLSHVEYTARPSQGYSYNSYGKNNYYYLHTDGNYYPVQRERPYEWVGLSYQRRYRLYFSVGNTDYYLSGTGVTTTAPTNVTSATATIWTGVLYTQTTVTQTKLAALKTSVGQFVDIIAADATQHNVEHRISIVKYASNAFFDDPQSSVTPESDLTEGNHRGANGNNNYNYTEVLINRRDPKEEATYIKNQVNALQSGGATASDFGMNKARYLLASIPADEFEDRSKVVVMFTDGEPTYGNSFDNTVANNTIGFAYDLKHNTDDLLAPYNGKTYQFDATVFSVGVFDNETNDIRNYMNYVSSNYPNAQSMTNGGTSASSNYYFKAETADNLNEIFVAIAGASGAMDLPSSTIVQDMVSPNFHLNVAAAGPVTAYAPKFLRIENGEYIFEPHNDNGTLTVNSAGVVTGGTENKLPSNFVRVNGKTIQMEGFNFSEHWCGNITDDHGVDTPHGRKIVIKIPVEVEGGMWGDGIQTNDPANSYVQAGDVLYGPFNNLAANVMGSVWTEIVTQEPDGYRDDDIDSPEDLAWFVSRVNGRIHYNYDNNIASNTTLNGKLTADIDMSAHNWVPIGAGYQCNTNNEFVLDANGKKIKLAYEGEFDGNGHVITGLKNNADKWYKTAAGQENEVVVFPGMFSNVKGTVHDVFILDSDFRGKYHGGAYEGKFVYHGILADTLTGGTIYNCEAAGRITCNNDAAGDDELVYGGLVGLNDGGTIHSSMAMAKLTGYAMGGALGENRNGTFSNSFTNGEYHYLANISVEAKPVGGLAATNNGTINNCYVRFERNNENLRTASFGMLIGAGTEPSNSYIPQIVTWSRPNSESNTTQVNMNTTVPNSVTTPDLNPDNSYTLSVNKTFYNMFTNDNSTGGTWGTLTIGSRTYNVYKDGTSLVDKLNQNKGDGATWKRTTAGAYSTGAGNINEDYPVLQLPGYTCLASTDGITIDYAHNLSDMLHRHNSGAMNENTAMPPTNKPWYHGLPTNDYSVSESPAINGGTINLFVNDDNRSTTKAQKEQSTDDNVVVYIDENISLLQDAGGSIEAYTGQTLQAYGNTDIQAGERWHNISSSLSNSLFGWGYTNNGQVEHNEEPNPCGWILNNSNEDQAFYPIDLSSWQRGDFYCFYEPQYHWINFRRNGQSHWHMDLINDAVGYDVPTNHAHIDYVNEEGDQDNEDHFIPGKGYLAAVDMSQWWDFTSEDGDIHVSKQAQFMQNRGTLNNGNVSIKVTCTEGIGWTGRQGYNLLGNPYQSYLDFDAFVNGNSAILGNSAYANTYAVYDPASDTWLQYLAGSSAEGTVSDRYINMHQGFFIQTNNKDENAAAIFTNEMRTNQKGNGFRGNKNHYPLVNFTLTDDEGNKDIAVLEVSRPENDGAKKIFVSTSKGRLSLRHDNEDFAILFRDMQSGSQPLYFEAKEDGTFTLSWNTANANFSSLTLVDNLTGVKYDMLANDSYTFQGSMSDYRSRFKVVFGAFTDVEENEETVTDNFAFFDGSDWVVNGQGQLTVTDMTGRTVYATNLTNDQNRVSLNGVANGIYLMRVANGQNVMVQKIVVR